ACNLGSSMTRRGRQDLPMCRVVLRLAAVALELANDLRRRGDSAMGRYRRKHPPDKTVPRFVLAQNGKMVPTRCGTKV
ncbi:MAG: hypothetical protein OXN84_18405, partial [Albidovulum sp.]|nr:hypothetical protein [Albidovulum sp.]